jgi:hypothetical protein
MKKLILYGAVAAVGGVAAFGFARFHDGIAKESEPLAVEPRIVKLTAKPNSTTAFHVNIVNTSDQPVKIVGADRDCTCLVTDGLPIEVGARSTHNIAASFTSGDSGPFTHQIEFYAESPSGLRRLPVEIRGEVLPADVP